MTGRHPVLENIPTDPNELRDAYIRLAEADHIRRGEKQDDIAKEALRGRAGGGGEAARSGPSPWLAAVLSAIGTAVLVGGILIAYGRDDGSRASAITNLTAQVAKLETATANLPTIAATVARLEGQAGSAAAAREAARQDAEKLGGDIQALRITVSEMGGRLGVQGSALTLLQGTSNVVAGMRAEMDAERRANTDRDRIQDERLRSLAEIVTSMRDALVQRGVTPTPPPRRSDAPPGDEPRTTTVPIRLRPLVAPRPFRVAHAP